MCTRFKVSKKVESGTEKEFGSVFLRKQASIEDIGNLTKIVCVWFKVKVTGSNCWATSSSFPLRRRAVFAQFPFSSKKFFGS